jgi:hypothetical protein
VGGRRGVSLRSNITDWSDEQLWRAYIQLTQAEAAFRIQKDQHKVRPDWHQRADRVVGPHPRVLPGLRAVDVWRSRASLGNVPRTVLEELVRIQSHDVAPPTATHGQIHLRCVAQPDAAQAALPALLDRLGLVLPKRMRLAEAELPARALAAVTEWCRKNRHKSVRAQHAHPSP